MKNDQKAITLIALVITIVVLIVLASVAITLSLGDNGIFKKAVKAKEDTLVAQNEEAMQIAEATNSMDEIITSDRLTTSSRQFGYFTMSTDQTGTGGHTVAYDTTKESRGLTLDTTNNSVKLTKGKSYKISFGMRGETISNNDAAYAVYDVTNSKYVSQTMVGLSATYNGGAWTSVPSTECIYSPSTDCNIIIKNNNTSYYFKTILSVYAYWVIEEL